MVAKALRNLRASGEPRFEPATRAFRMKTMLKLPFKRQAGRPPERKALYRDLGDAARSRKEWESAARNYALHLEANPGDFGIWVQLGHALKESGQLDRAELAYAEAARLDENDADLWLNRGHLAKLRGDVPSAQDHYARSYAIDRNGSAALELNALERQPQNAVRAAAQSEWSSQVGLILQRPIRAMEIYNGSLLSLWVGSR
jgi:O-antigen biosynthesis protein